MYGLQLDTNENNSNFGVKVDVFFGVCMYFGSRNCQKGAEKYFYVVKAGIHSGVITIVNFILFQTMPLPVDLAFLLKN